MIRPVAMSLVLALGAAQVPLGLFEPAGDDGCAGEDGGPSLCGAQGGRTCCPDGCPACPRPCCARVLLDLPVDPGRLDPAEEAAAPAPFPGRSSLVEPARIYRPPRAAV